MGIPPRTQRGPSTPMLGSRIKPIDFSSDGSTVLPVDLSISTSLPDGQSQALAIAFSLIFGSSDCGICGQISPPRWQNRAEAQRISASLSFKVGPSRILAIVSKGSLLLVSVPLKLIFTWVPSQNGLFLDWPQRHREYIGWVWSCLPINHSTGVLVLWSQRMVAGNSGKPPETMYGPFFVTWILGVACKPSLSPKSVFL